MKLTVMMTKSKTSHGCRKKCDGLRDAEVSKQAGAGPGRAGRQHARGATHPMAKMRRHSSTIK